MSELYQKIGSYIFFTIGLLSSFLAIFSHIRGSDTLLKRVLLDNSLYVISIFHCLLVFFVLVIARIKIIGKIDDIRIIQNKHLNNPQRLRKAQKKLNDHFLYYWDFLWMSWGLLYFLFPFSTFIEDNSLNSIQIEGQKSVVEFAYQLRYINGLMLFANSIGGFFLFKLAMTFIIMKDKNEELFDKIISYIYIFIITILVYVQIEYSTCRTCIDAASLISGMLVAIPFGLLAGRLDSRYLKAYKWQITLLYVYATLQLFYISYNTIYIRIPAVIVSYAAFTLKTFFYIFIYDIFRNHKILFFTYKIRNVEFG